MGGHSFHNALEQVFASVVDHPMSMVPSCGNNNLPNTACAADAPQQAWESFAANTKWNPGIVTNQSMDYLFDQFEPSSTTYQRASQSFGSLALDQNAMATVPQQNTGTKRRHTGSSVPEQQYKHLHPAMSTSNSEGRPQLESESIRHQLPHLQNMQETLNKRALESATRKHSESIPEAYVALSLGPGFCGQVQCDQLATVPKDNKNDQMCMGEPLPSPILRTDQFSRFRTVPGTSEEQRCWAMSFEHWPCSTMIGLAFKKEVYNVLRYNEVIWTSWASVDSRCKQMATMTKQAWVNIRRNIPGIDVEHPESMSDMKISLTKGLRRHRRQNQPGLCMWVTLHDPKGDPHTVQTWGAWDPLFLEDNIKLPSTNSTMNEAPEQALDPSDPHWKNVHRKQIRSMLQSQIHHALTKTHGRFDVDRWSHSQTGSGKLSDGTHRLIEGVSEGIRSQKGMGNASGSTVTLSWRDVVYSCEVLDPHQIISGAKPQSPPVLRLNIKATVQDDSTLTIHETKLTLREKDCMFGDPSILAEDLREEIEEVP